MKSGDLIRHQYSGEIYLSTSTLWSQNSTVKWKEGQVGIFLDFGHKHRRLGTALVRVLTPNGIGFICYYDIQIIRTCD